VIEHFDALWNRAAPAFARTHTHQRARKMALGALACLGRHTVTGIICTSAEQFRDWSADYRLMARQRFDQGGLFGVVVDEVVRSLAHERPLEIALDDTTVGKTGRKVSGAQWRPDRTGPKFQMNLIWGVRYLQISAALPESSRVATAACMVPVEFKHCPSPAKPRKDATAHEMIDYRLARNRAALPVQACTALAALRLRVQPQRHIICSGDGGYTNRTMLKSLPDNVSFVGRIRKDAQLWAAPTCQNQLGRRRVYGAQLPTPDQLRTSEDLPWQPVQVHLGGQLREVHVKTIQARWKPAGARDLRLIIIRPLKYRLTRNGRVCYRQPVYLICTNPDLDITQAVQTYVRRWGIEQNFRDEKQVLGIGQSYVRTPASLQALPALIVAAYSMLRIACRKTDCRIDQPKWRAPTTTNQLTANQEIAALRHHLWGDALTRLTPQHFNGFAQKHHHKTNPPKCANPLASAVIYASRC
jgi:hypothetical protein